MKRSIDCEGNAAEKANAKATGSAGTDERASKGSGSSGRPRVLVVDDDAMTRRIYSLLLRHSGYEVEAAADGHQGWSKLKCGRYDLLVTDNDMPGLPGLQLISQVREAGMELPIILASGSDEVTDVVMGSERRVSAVLKKPFSLSNLLSTVRRVLPSLSRSESADERRGGTPSADSHGSARLRGTGETAEHSEHRNRQAAAKPKADPGPPTPAKRVLIVDDDTLVRASLAAVLECEGYEVYGAPDGIAALQSTKLHQPDLVLLDLNMPNLDGWSTYEQLENCQPLTPVVVITARPHQYRQAAALGVDAFMEKPLNIPILLRAIHALTHEAVTEHDKRVTQPGFVTSLLENQPALRGPG